MGTKKVEILGTGCPKCRSLEKSAREVVERLRLDVEVTKVESLDEILRRGVLVTPAIAIDGTVVSSGRVLSSGDLENLLA